MVNFKSLKNIEYMLKCQWQCQKRIENVECDSPHSKYQKGGPMMSSLDNFLKDMHTGDAETINPVNLFNEVSILRFLGFSMYIY